MRVQSSLARIRLQCTRPYLRAIHRRHISCTPTRWATNRIYTPVRNAEEFDHLLLLSSSSRQALITLWTASWCRTCKTVTPFVEGLIKDGQAINPTSQASDATVLDVPATPPVGYVEVEMDAPDMTEVSSRYMIRSVPLLLAFSRGEPQTQTMVTDAKKMSERAFLQEWIQTEARRAGDGGAGGSLLGRLFG